jgi:hypothetical protein
MCGGNIQGTSFREYPSGNIIQGTSLREHNSVNIQGILSAYSGNIECIFREP